MKIKILSWNVRGLNDREKCKLLKLVIRSQKAYLVCLIETKMQEMSLKVVKSLGVGRFLDWGAVDARRASKGILIFWDNIVLDLLELECGGFTISGRFRNVEDGFVWVFTGVYGPVFSREKKDFWDELGAIKGLWDDPWCVRGDFNFVRFPRERRNEFSLTEKMRRFFEVIEEPRRKNYPFLVACSRGVVALTLKLHQGWIAF